MEKFDFVGKVAEIRKKAKENIEKGPVTSGYHADREKIIALLNNALATEIVCVLRYKLHYQMAQGIHSEAIAEQFLEHAKTEQEHVDELAERISQLQGNPDYDPATLTKRSLTEYQVTESLLEMVREDLVAERIVISVYSEMIRSIGEGDPTTRRLLEHILAEEEEHADDLVKILKRGDVQHLGKRQTEAA